MIFIGGSGHLRAEWRDRGLTLVEVLVCLAIIAILALAGFYGYQGASVRSKVARVKAELRTFAAAIETYRVDNQRYPRMAWGGMPFLDGFYRDGNFLTLYFNTLGQLTSPVAYVAPSALVELFPSREGASRNHRLYHYFETETLRAAAARPGPGNQPLFASMATEGFVRTHEERIGPFMVSSYGPDQDSPPPGDPSYWTVYDPTNGATSGGNLFRTARAGDIATSIDPF